MWPTLFPICKDDTLTSRQSPIDIKSSRAKYDSKLDPLEMSDYDTANSNKMKLSNNGHSVTVSMASGKFASMVEHKGMLINMKDFLAS